MLGHLAHGLRLGHLRCADHRTKHDVFMSGGWSEVDVETIKTMWTGGSSASQIARVLPGRRTRSAVLGKVHRMKLPPRATSSSTKQKRIYNHIPRPVAVKLEARKAAEDEVDPGPMDPPIDTLTVRGDIHCRWPYDVGNTYHYCGQVPEKDRPFCPFHCGKAYQPQQPRKSAA